MKLCSTHKPLHDRAPALGALASRRRQWIAMRVRLAASHGLEGIGLRRCTRRRDASAPRVGARLDKARGVNQIWPRGFTLAESLFAMTIVSFVILAIIGMMPSGLSSLREADRTAAEVRICQTITADYETRKWSDLMLQSSAPPPLYFDEHGAQTTLMPDDQMNPTQSAIFAAQATVVFNPAGGQQSMASAGLLPGEPSPSPFLLYVRIAITDNARNANTLQQALNGSEVPYVHVYTTTVVNLAPENGSAEP